jgi:putative hemolysin
MSQTHLLPPYWPWWGPWGHGSPAGPFLEGCRRFVDRILGLDQLRDRYARLPASGAPGEFLARILESLDVTVRIDPAEFAAVPLRGPLVLTANHPYGAIEGIALARHLLEIRPDVRILANHLLATVPEMRDLCFFVDPFGQAGSARRNLAALKAAIRWVHEGGCLITFPAGEVSRFRLATRQVDDKIWPASMARLIRRSGAAVLPVFIGGANGPLFQVAGLLHPRIRTAMLPRELLNKRHFTLPIRIGSVIPAARIRSLPSDSARCDYLRFRAYLLRNTPDVPRPGGRPAPTAEPATAAPLPPVLPPREPDLMTREVRDLPERLRLVQSGEYEIWHAYSWQIPNVLYEIGRLREITFRQVGEGTGRVIDIDSFDAHYLHLFLWNNRRNELVGAYRLGPADTLSARFGPSGLYTNSLFKIRTGWLERIQPALELGRSFVRPEYQKDYLPLLMLWRGIGHYIARNPRYRFLFGPVSISREYCTLSQRLMVDFLKLNNFHHEAARGVKARNPLRTRTPLRLSRRQLESWQLDAADLSEWIAELEPDRKGLPILLRQYLKLGGRLIGFNVDPEFQDVLDGLILVDLVQTPPKLLIRYFGEAGLAAFRAYHEARNRPAGQNTKTGRRNEAAAGPVSV